MSNNRGYFDSEEFRELLRKYEKAKQENATPYFAVEEFADLMSYYLSEEEVNKAFEVLEISKRLYPDARENIKMSAKYLYCIGEHIKALRLLAQLSPFDDDCELLILQAEIYIALKKFKEAREIAIDLIQKKREEPECIYDGLELLLDCGVAPEALSICNALLVQSPGNRTLREIKAECLIELQQTDDAVEIYNSLLDDDPYSTFYWEQLGHTCYLAKRFGKAIECFDYEYAINDSIGYAQIMQAYCYYYAGDYSSARTIFTHLHKQYPGATPPLFYIALTFHKEGNDNDALELFKEYINLQEENTIEIMLARINKAIILEKSGNAARADETISIALLTHPSNMKQLILRNGSLYELRDKENLTYEDMNLLDTKEWSQSEELYKLAEHLVEQECFTIAERVLNYCLDITRDKSDLYAHLAYIQWKSGRKEEALPNIGKAIDEKSWILFNLFGIPYKYNMQAEEFAREAEERDL